jgi:UDP:flavonoid glycosyltransferase YjiC (YdhE family)
MRFLFTTFEGGGHVPPALLVARRLIERGHEVLFVSDEANRSQAARAGLGFHPWTSAPNRAALAGLDDPLRDWRARWPPRIVGEICRSVICGPAEAYARDVAERIERFRPDAVVSNELLFGSVIAAEASGTPAALLTSNVWCFPTRDDVPPFGPGFAPARTRFEAGRDRAARRMIGRWYDVGLPDLNRARQAQGLAPLAATLDQLKAVDLVLLGTSAAFDYGASDAPPPFVYAGPLGDTPDWAQTEDADVLQDEGGKPRVLISFSITQQGQAATVGRCLRAARDLHVLGVLTLGPALKGAALPHAGNVRVLDQADHERLVPRMDAVICHGGHGTMMRCVRNGVPVVCIPTGRDQPENAQRLEWAGAGLRLPRFASVSRIRRAVVAVLQDRSFRDNAAKLGAAVAAETDGGLRATIVLEGLAGQRRSIA